MIALGGAIGIGLVIGTGSALKQGQQDHPYVRMQATNIEQGGPLGLFLGFSFVGRSPVVSRFIVPDVIGACIGLVW